MRVTWLQSACRDQTINSGTIILLLYLHPPHIENVANAPVKNLVITSVYDSGAPRTATL